MPEATVRPCPLCGDNLDVEWTITQTGQENVTMNFECPACEGSGTIRATIGQVMPIKEGE